MPKPITLHKRKDQSFSSQRSFWEGLERSAKDIAGFIVLLGLGIVFLTNLSFLVVSAFIMLLLLDRLWGMKIVLPLRPPF